MKKLALLMIITSTPLCAQSYEDEFFETKPYILREVVDGFTDGALSKIDQAARDAGRAIREAIDRQGFHNSQRRIERAQRTLPAHVPAHVYRWGGGRSRNV